METLKEVCGILFFMLIALSLVYMIVAVAMIPIKQKREDKIRRELADKVADAFIKSLEDKEDN